jgi:hypothetical protein
MQAILLLSRKIGTIAVTSSVYTHLPILLPREERPIPVNRDRQLIVNLEVIVPRLVLPIPSLDVSKTSDEVEQVRLSSVDVQPTLAQHSEQPGAVGEATTSATYATQQRPFRLFSIKGVQTHGQVLLLLLLRRWQRRDRRQHGAGTQLELITDELTFTVEARQSKTPSERTRRTLLPGLNQVVIFLDEEGTPNSYSIDEAER